MQIFQWKFWHWSFFSWHKKGILRKALLWSHQRMTDSAFFTIGQCPLLGQRKKWLLAYTDTNSTVRNMFSKNLYSKGFFPLWTGAIWSVSLQKVHLDVTLMNWSNKLWQIHFHKSCIQMVFLYKLKQFGMCCCITHMRLLNSKFGR